MKGRKNSEKMREIMSHRMKDCKEKRESESE